MPKRNLLWPACLVLATATVLRADPKPADRIAYLEFHIAGGSITFIDAQVVPGKLKVPRQAVPVAGHVQVDVLDSQNRVVARQLIPHPARPRYEFVDSDGLLKSVIVPSDSVDFFVRVPYSPGIARARFDEIEAVTLVAGRPQVRIRAMGTVEVPATADHE